VGKHESVVWQFASVRPSRVQQTFLADTARLARPFGQEPDFLPVLKAELVEDCSSFAGPARRSRLTMPTRMLGVSLLLVGKTLVLQHAPAHRQRLGE
jgi:hypothetical protein